MRLLVAHAIRTLLKQPGLMLAAVLMLAVGIGANTAMFSIVRAVLLRPLGVEAPQRVVIRRAAADGEHRAFRCGRRDRGIRSGHRSRRPRGTEPG
jgi:hypothetical protein